MYNPKHIEPKWQSFWQEQETFRTLSPSEAGNKPKKYVLSMFPYPSGEGLHVGHAKVYSATDAYARYNKTRGYNVLHPMGWDAFGLPAENYAIKTGTHPAVTTAANVANYTRQMKSMGLSYDWSREINTTDADYIKQTQWIFLQLFERGLAYEQDLPINYCPSCKTGLANEEVVGDNKCDRCGTTVERRKIRQWVLKITEYAERLLADIDTLDWPESIKDMQRNWIGKSEWVEFRMKKDWDSTIELAVYTTRIDTVYGMTYVVLAADHKDVDSWITPEYRAKCDAYITHSKAKSDLERTNEGKEKTGEFTGSFVVNPFNGEKIPVWIGDYVLGSYGTGAVMAVPAHDERDFEFAKKHNLEIREVIIAEEWRSDILNNAYTKDWFLDNSWEFLWDVTISSAEARIVFAEKAEAEGFGKKKTNYKLRDWLFSRQRYWGEPIPLIHLTMEDVKQLPHISDISQATDMNLAYILKRDEVSGECTTGTMCHGKVRELVVGGKIVSKIYDGIYGKIICDYSLPLELPEVERYEPAGDGQSPLATVPSFVNIQIASNLTGKRETNTMPQWAGSCWYYLRFMDPKFADAPASKEMIDYWGQVDKYVGGAEHAVLHLLYARFWHKVLFDIGVVSFKEPFQDLIGVGLILGPDGGKMSKSRGNVVNPDDVIKEFGADTLRMYELSISDFRDAAPWNTEAIVGVRRFLERSLSLFENPRFASDDMKAMKLLHKTIKKVGEDIEAFKFNTAISALMILLNEGVPKDLDIQMEWKESFAILLHPFAPHLAEELWSILGKTTSVFLATWPEYHDFMLLDDEVTIAIQINGKLRGTMTFLHGVAQEEVAARAFEDPEIYKWIEGKEMVREIFVPNKLLSIVVK